MKKSFITLSVAFSLFLFLGTSLALATTTPPTGGGNSSPTGGGNPGINTQLPNPFKGGTTLFAFLETLVRNVIMPIGTVLAVLAFIYSGFLYVTAQGDTKQITAAHTALLNTAIGTALLLGAWGFAEVIKNTVNQLM